ncbi:MAG: aspartyl/asparaginyl beta-hydroxylase domain-containing protein [Pseudomonadota bacterium]
MSALSRSQLRQLSQARKRPAFERLGVLPRSVIAALLRFWEENKQNNALSDMMEERARLGLPLENAAYLSEHYSQVLLQTPALGGDPSCAEDYVVPSDAALVSAIQDIAGPFTKARLSALRPGGTIAEHIDDPTQTRSLALLDGDHEFWIRTGSSLERVPMRRGEVWFVNTAWPHWVVNPFDRVRMALLLNLTSPGGWEKGADTRCDQPRKHQRDPDIPNVLGRSSSHGHTS